MRWVTSTARIGKLGAECRLVPPRLLAHGFKLLLTFAQVPIHALPICHVESQSAEDVFQVQRRERFGNSLGGLSPQKCVNHRVEGDAGACDEVSFRCAARHLPRPWLQPLSVYANRVSRFRHAAVSSRERLLRRWLRSNLRAFAPPAGFRPDALVSVFIPQCVRSRVALSHHHSRPVERAVLPATPAGPAAGWPVRLPRSLVPKPHTRRDRSRPAAALQPILQAAYPIRRERPDWDRARRLSGDRAVWGCYLLFAIERESWLARRRLAGPEGLVRGGSEAAHE